MQVGVGWWLMFEDRWAAVLRFLSRCSSFLLCVVCISVFCIAVFLRCSFVCVTVFCIAVFVTLSWFLGLSGGRVGVVSCRLDSGGG